MEQQSTSATPGKRQDYVQYTPQIVTNYNQQYGQQQEQGLASPSQEHYEDSMLELKDVDTLPSNYAFVSHQIPPNTMYNNQQPPQQVPQQVIYLPAETQQRVYETPSNNNYIHSGMIMNPNVVPNHHLSPSSSAEPSSFIISKYTSWTRVVMVFAILLGIYGCFGLVSQLILVFSYSTFSSVEGISVNTSVISIIASCVNSLIEIGAGSVGVWSTITKNPKHRKNTTIAHLVLLSIVVLYNIIYGIIGTLEMFLGEQTQEIASAGLNPQNLIIFLVFSLLLFVLMIFACCGSCIGCQAYRFRIMSKLQDAQPEIAQGEGFMVMRDEV